MYQNNSFNHLSNQSNPYLLQHAKNPVDWYPWGDEAFNSAKQENKMIFLSIGYSTCHWCHVMAHESFENADVANILRRDYISIKVDREERPDIDEVYMNVCQSLTGNGGWPLTIIMTADKKPFFAGTYFPIHNQGGRLGLVELLNQITHLWHNDRKNLVEQGDDLVNHFENEKINRKSKISNNMISQNAINSLKRRFDAKYGGFSIQPKFPTPHNLFFLLRYYKHTNNKQALDLVEKTLQSMANGGIFDHVGYGFSRYSTDNTWLVPHFEKMLYDNALLIIAYCEAYAITQNKIYQNVVEKIAEFLIRDMKSAKGAFYSAFDADSEGVEGKYYVFSYTELQNFLNEKELKFLEKHYNVSEKGNFEGKNILNKIDTPKSVEGIEKTVLNKLYEYRKKRVSPFLDTKILSSWNGLMIAALSLAGSIIDSKYVEHAKKTTEFILSYLVDSELNLYTSFKDGKLSNKGFLSDYANMTWGLIELYKATQEINYLKTAIKLTDKTIDKFWDKTQTKFFMNEENATELPIRPKDEYDGAMPSGNSVMIMNLVKLYNYTYDDKIKSIIDKAVNTFAYNAENTPSAYMHLVSALLTYESPHRQIIITGKNQKTLYDKINKQFLPFTTTILFDGNGTDVMPHLKDYSVEESLKAYTCENFTCSKPISSESELLKSIL